MSLREYLKELKIDQIEDDTEFCDKEYNAIMHRTEILNHRC
jgi:hypothetical protein